MSQRITQPTTESITLQEAKAHLFVTVCDDDVLIARKLRTAREFVERMTGECLAQSQWKKVYKSFPHAISWWLPAPTTFPYYGNSQIIYVPKPPLVSIDLLEYLHNGTWTTIDPSTYSIDSISFPGRVYPTGATIWPIADVSAETVRITWTSGYTQANLPADRREQVLKVLWELYNDRGATGDCPTSAMWERLFAASQRIFI